MGLVTEKKGRVAQLVEQGIENPRVGGSIPSPATIHFQSRHPLNQMNSEQLSQCIDALCQCGCDAVRATITAMESGVVVPQVETLSEEERQVVLEELKAVMAVYDRKS
jgi:4-hydroxy-3-methylbut-2-en-1-yl diphosphate synthase IspG/GcpE